MEREQEHDPIVVAIERVLEAERAAEGHLQECRQQANALVTIPRSSTRCARKRPGRLARPDFRRGRWSISGVGQGEGGSRPTPCQVRWQQQPRRALASTRHPADRSHPDGRPGRAAARHRGRAQPCFGAQGRRGRRLQSIPLWPGEARRAQAVGEPRSDDRRRRVWRRHRHHVSGANRNVVTENTRRTICIACRAKAMWFPLNNQISP